MVLCLLRQFGPIRTGMEFYSDRAQQPMEVAMIRIMAAVAGAVLVALAMVEVLWAVPGHSGVVQSEVITVQGARHSLPLQGTASKAFPFLDRAAGGPTTPP